MPTRARTTTLPNRVAPGVPSGGEFSFAPRSESDVQLVEVHPALARTETPLTPAELSKQAKMSARHWIRSRGLMFTDADDIAQSTVETALRARMNNDSIVITERYIHTIAHGHVAAALRGNLRVEDRKAKAIYDRRIGEFEAAESRAMTPNEKKALAVEIRQTWPDPRHRPSEKFVELSGVRTMSLDNLNTSTGLTLADRIADPNAGEDDLAVDADSVQARVLDLAENGKKVVARRLVYNAIAGLSDAPQALEAHMSTHKAGKARKTVKDAGGVAAAIADWENALETPATDALFAPFGDIGPDERDDVCALFTRLSDRADDLYESAVKFAAQPRAS